MSVEKTSEGHLGPHPSLTECPAASSHCLTGPSRQRREAARASTEARPEDETQAQRH